MPGNGDREQIFVWDYTILSLPSCSFSHTPPAFSPLCCRITKQTSWSLSIERRTVSIDLSPAISPSPSESQSPHRSHAVWPSSIPLTFLFSYCGPCCSLNMPDTLPQTTCLCIVLSPPLYSMIFLFYSLLCSQCLEEEGLAHSRHSMALNWMNG